MELNAEMKEERKKNAQLIVENSLEAVTAV